MSRLVHRITMFKLPGAEKQAQLLAAYDKLAKDQNKVRVSGTAGSPRAFSEDK